jgi:methylmalonyl-CoA mutase cobalamin-binding domain/chain
LRPVGRLLPVHSERRASPALGPERTPLALRCPRRSVIVVVGDGTSGELSGRALVSSLRELSIDVVYLGREESASRIAAIAADEQADAVELCMTSGAGVTLLRQLLRALIEIGRRDISIVVHRGL